MVTLMKMEPADPVEKDGVLMSRAVFILAGLSGDEKPTVEYKGTLIANGSKYQVIGGASYTYDEENEAWAEDAGGSGSGSGSGGSGGSEISTELATQILQIVTLATGSTPITRIVVEDAANTRLDVEAWDIEYVVPGTSLEELTIVLPETRPTAVSASIKVVIEGITRHEDPEDDSEDPDLIPPKINLPEGILFTGAEPEMDGDGWIFIVDNNLFATGTVFINDQEETDQNGGE